jgi:di/tricarboxylate transporter
MRMLSDANIVFVIVGVTAVLMASNRLRFDIIALLVVLALVLTGILSVDEALAGFGSPVVVLVATLLVVGEMLDRTGVAAAIGNWILRHGGGSEIRLYILLMVCAAGLGAVMSSTAVVAIFIPIVLRVAAQTNMQSSRLLLPMSYAALISGMLTLIATTPNLVVSEELASSGYEALGFFSFAPVGLAVLCVAIAYMLLVGRKLLPERGDQGPERPVQRSMSELWHDYRGEREIRSARVLANSPAVGKRIGDCGLDSKYGIRILGIRRLAGKSEEIIASPSHSLVIETGDNLLVAVTDSAMVRAETEQYLQIRELSDWDFQRWAWELGCGTAIVHPESSFIGTSLRESEFRTRYNLHVLGLRRGGELVGDYLDTRLASSDSLFVIGPWKYIDNFRAEHSDFVVTEVPSERADVVPEYRKMSLALAILAGMVLLTIFDVVPVVVAVIVAALAAVLSRTLTMEDAYRSIHWSSVVLVAGMLPLADALQKTGGTDLVVDALMGVVGDASPSVMLSVLFFLTASLGLFLSNTASAVLVAPIAIVAAQMLDVSPYPFAVAVLIAASAAFITPFSTPVVTLVVEPGRYRFGDFLKIGIPLLLLTWLTTLVVTPIIFPFGG